MSIRKRILALVGAGALAVVLGGVVTSHRASHVEAAAPTQAAIGCANSTLATDIAFPTITGGSIITSNQVASPAAILSAGAVAPGALSITTPNGVVLCGAVFEDVPAATATAGQDADPSTIDGGTITFNLTSGVATILESNASNFTVSCGSTTIFEGCQGANLLPSGACVAALTCTFATPNPANTVHVALRGGASFPLIGASSPVITLSATYNRFPSLTALAGAVPGPAATAPISTNTTTIGLTVPAYAMTLTPSPATISAASGTGAGSTLTAALYHGVANTCSTVTAPIAVGTASGTGFVICLGAGGSFIQTVAGAESGVVTFSTSSGVFGNTTAAQGGGQQIFSVHCGQLPATSPVILIPTLGLNPLFSLSACVTAQATLFGGGAAGTAIVVANFVGDFTGATAQATTTVSLAPQAATVALSRGCNEVITAANTAAGTPVSTIVGQVQPGGIVVSVWRFDNSLHAFQAGFFSTAGAPTDFSTTGPSQSLFICVSASGTFPTGAF